MSVSIAFIQDPSITDTLDIIKKISQSRFKVYQAFSPAASETYALKAFPNNASGTRQYNNESIISTLSHPNIIKYIPVTVSFEDENNFHCILTEFAKYGNIFDLVSGGVFNSEILIRTYFHQVVAGVEYLHSQGIAHLDLKLENLMLGSGFTLKIIDFDQAQSVEEIKIKARGTQGYRAPEIIDGTCVNFQAADIYSLGIILYAFKAQKALFREIITKDAKGESRTSLKDYSTFIKKNEAFWEMKVAKMTEPTTFSQDFRDLVNGMLQFEVSKRFRLDDVRNSKWFNGPVLSKEELRAEMKAKWQHFKRS